jgi:hypothetical protein
MPAGSTSCAARFLQSRRGSGTRSPESPRPNRRWNSCAGTLDDKRAGGPASTVRFASLANFLENIPTICPHDLFRRDDDPKARASQAHPEFADVSRIIVNRKQNAATDAAALIIPAVGNNKLRHETLQRFMLANDSVTVAILGWKLEPAFDAVKTPKSRACRSETGL